MQTTQYGARNDLSALQWPSPLQRPAWDSLLKPYASPKDAFCLRETRVVNGYRRISLFNHTIEVPKVKLYEEVEVHLAPDTAKQAMQIRIWWNDTMVHSVALPLEEFRVHL